MGLLYTHVSKGRPLQSICKSTREDSHTAVDIDDSVLLISPFSQHWLMTSGRINLHQVVPLSLS